MKNPKLLVRRDVWADLVKELQLRGEGIRETGAFLLGKPDNRTVTGFVCYDDLDPNAFDTGIIVFNGDGYIPLWERCIDLGVKVLADVHTHPGDWTGQSGSDQRHPMIAQKGHIALILPDYALEVTDSLEGIGIHEFLGNRKWKSWAPDSGVLQIVN